jgi:hypothetical protein
VVLTGRTRVAGRWIVSEQKHSDIQHPGWSAGFERLGIAPTDISKKTHPTAIYGSSIYKYMPLTPQKIGAQLS